MKSISTKIRPIVSVIILIMMAFCYQIATAAPASQVTTGKDVYDYGETIKVNFSNAPGNSRDWICIVPIGSPDTDGGDYKNIPQGMIQGVLIYDPPSSPGKYEVRAYYNYSSKGYVVSARHTFSVVRSSEATAQYMARMERKTNPNNPLESNLPPGKGLVYIFRESGVGGFSTDSTNIQVQIMASGKEIVAISSDTYFPFSVTAGDVKFTTGRITEQRNIQGNNVEVDLWGVQAGEATINVNPGHVYYIKLKVIFVSGFGNTTLEHVPHQDGADLIASYKLTLLK